MASRQLGTLTGLLYITALAVFFGTLLAFLYMVTASSETYPVMTYILGQRSGARFFLSTEALFIVVCRFLLGFGLSWAPLASFFLLFRSLGRPDRTKDHP